MPTKNKSIAIIGGGASGLLAAWLLEQDYDVLLFEKEPYLGGHACSIEVPSNGHPAIIETGAEFFSPTMFTTLTRLLNILNIKTHDYALTYTFENIPTNDYIILPPIHDNTVSWHSFTPHNIFDMIQFKDFVDAGADIVTKGQTDITLQQYAQKIGLSDNFMSKFLIPFFASAWGSSIADTKEFAAYDILKWVVLNKAAGLHAASWYEIVGGTSNYIQTLAKQLNSTRLVLPRTIDNIIYDDQRYTLIDNNSQSYVTDHIIIATNAVQASHLLNNLVHAQQAKNILNKIDYFKSTIAVHGDVRFMPADKSRWSVINIRFDNKEAATTIYKPWLSASSNPVFRSWITYQIGASPKLPESLYALKHFYHGKVTPAYFEAQKRLAAMQGQHNMWFAGIYTHDEDSHNSALISSINIAQKLAPDSKRLSLLI